MRVRPFVVAALFGCCLLAVVGALSAPAAAQSIDVEHTLAQNDADGQVDVRTALDVPGGTTTLEITIPEGTEVYESRGFSQVGERTYEWTKTTNQPYLRYSMEGNVTLDRGRGEEYLYAVTDEWAVVRTPNIRLDWTGVRADVDVSATADGEGVAGRHITYLGPYEETTRSAPDQTFRFVEADASDLREDREDVLDTLEYTSERLGIGRPNDEVLVIVVPSDGISWAATGVQRGDADMWVRDAERLDNPKNTWTHEYVHTLQDYDRAAATRWTIEGMADYYAAVVTYEQGYIDYETFRDRMAEGQRDDVRLDDPSTWEGTQGNYDKGALVFGHLDRRLRAETDATVDEVVASFNGQDDDLTHEELLDAVEDAGGSDLRSDAARYTETTDSPSLWSREAHVEAFGGPDLRYEFESFAVSGPYREASLESPRAVAGETLTTTVRVRNEGSQKTEFAAGLHVDGERVEGATGTLAAGEETTLTFAHEFESAGEYDLEVGSASTTAVVEDPAGIEVTGLTAEPSDAALGETVRLRATVAADADRPAAGEVTFAVDGQPVATETVRLAGGGTTVEATTAFDAPSEYEVTAGGAAATVSVRDETATPGAGGEGPTGTGTTDDGETPMAEDGPGLGPATAAVALALAGLLARRRR